MAARLEVHRIGALDIVNSDRSLSGQITAIRKYLDDLGQEYAEGYLDVARQQHLDEVWLTSQMDAANDGSSGGAPELPDRLAGPTRAWLVLNDASQFPRLAALLDEVAFLIDTFRTNYKLAKECLEMHAGFGDPLVDSQQFRADKLAERARTFAGSHKERLGDLREQVGYWADRLDDAHKASDPHAIRVATAELGKKTAEAVDRVYPGRQSGRAAANGPAAATAEIEALPATPAPTPRPGGTDV